MNRIQRNICGAGNGRFSLLNLSPGIIYRRDFYFQVVLCAENLIIVSFIVV